MSNNELAHLTYEQLEQIDEIVDAFETGPGTLEEVSRHIGHVEQTLRPALLFELLTLVFESNGAAHGQSLDEIIAEFSEHEAVVRSAYDEAVNQPRENKPNGGGVSFENNGGTASRRIDQFLLEEELGRGGMGVVYRARDVELNRTVALKMVVAGQRVDETQTRRFRSEAEAVAKLQHPNIVQVFALGTSDGIPYLALEYVEGHSLADLLTDAPIEARAAATLCRKLANAMQHAHDNGVIHRDLKPGNILIPNESRQGWPGLERGTSETPRLPSQAQSSPVHADSNVTRSVSEGSSAPPRESLADASGYQLVSPRNARDDSTWPTDCEPLTRQQSEKTEQLDINADGRAARPACWNPKITDFGLAKSLGSDSELTRTGEVLGTPIYMSPEQATGQDTITPTSDVYSIGVILYRLLTGHVPFQSSAPIETLRMVIEDEPVSPNSLNRRVAKDLNTICLKCLEKLPRRRYQSAQGLADDLERFLTHQPIVARPAGMIEQSWKWIRRHQAVSVLLMALVLVAAAGVFGIVREYRRTVAEHGRAEANLQTARLREAEANARTLEAEAERLRANKQLMISRSIRLAAEARAIAKSNPVLSALLACEAVRITGGEELEPWRKTADEAEDGFTLPVVYESLIEVASRIGGVPLPHDSPVDAVDISPDGRWLVTGGVGELLIWDALKLRQVLDQPARHEELIVQSISCQPNDSIRFVRFNGNSRFATSDTNGWVRAYEISAKGEARCVLALQHGNNRGAPAAVQFTEQPNRLLTIGRDESVVWDFVDTPGSQLDRAKPEQVFSGSKSAISPDGHLLAVTNRRQRTFQVWRIGTAQDAERIPVIEQTGHLVNVMKFSPDSRWLYAGGSESYLWHVQRGTSRHPRFSLDDGYGYVSSAEFSRDSTTLAISTGASAIRTWQLDKLDETHSAIPPLHVLKGHERKIKDLHFVTDTSKYVASAADDGSIRVWNLTQAGLRRSTRVLHAHSQTVLGLCSDLAGSTLVASLYQGDVRIWNRGQHASGGMARYFVGGAQPHAWFAVRDQILIKSTKDIRAFQSAMVEPSFQLNQVSGAVFDKSDDGRRVVVVNQDEVVIVDHDMGEPIHLGKRSKPIKSVSISAEGEVLAISRGDGRVEVWDLPPRADGPIAASQPAPEIRLSRHQDSRVNSVVLSGNAEWLLVLGESSRLWDLTSNRETVIDVTSPEGVFSRDNQWLAISNVHKKSSTIYQLTHASAPKSHGAVAIDSKLQFSLDGKRIAGRTSSNTAEVWALADEPIVANSPPRHELVATLNGHVDRIDHIEFSPIPHVIATGSADATIRLWDLNRDQHDREPIVLRGHDDAITSLAFSTDGSRLLSASRDHTVRLWTLGVADILRFARRSAGRELTTDERLRYRVE